MSIRFLIHVRFTSSFLEIELPFKEFVGSKQCNSKGALLLFFHIFYIFSIVQKDLIYKPKIFFISANVQPANILNLSPCDSLK